ncbi:hypothetical protein O0L34_g10170 [Tuta absoluta]|nr:hypothetical protein O0L34_g10170 [Tuta absoluta]
MFLYEVMTAINLSANIINIVQFSGDTGTVHALLNSGACVLGCFIELLTPYWYSSKVADESMLISNAIYSSSWVGADMQLQKQIALMTLTTSKEVEFDAGPFHKMTLAALVTILRASYTFFTLISTTK